MVRVSGAQAPARAMARLVSPSPGSRTRGGTGTTGGTWSSGPMAPSSLQPRIARGRATRPAAGTPTRTTTSWSSLGARGSTFSHPMQRSAN
eukprot:scaffold10241_cov127-Isochrysis_galbana.AAC.7